jgi:hypothetical protein
LVLAERIGLIPDPWQERVLCHPKPREVLNCHRQSGKSTVAAIAAVWQSIYKPRSLTLVVAPSLRQSQELFKVIGTVFRAAGRPLADEESTLAMTLENGSRIVTLPSDSATIRGYSAVSLLIIDEAARVSDETFEALTPMVAVSRGRILALSTPWGARGWWHQASQSSRWRVTTVPVTECSRIDAAYLAEQLAEHGQAHYESEWLCRFVSTDDSAFSTEMIAALSDPRRLALLPPGGALFYSVPGKPTLVRTIDAPARPVRRIPCSVGPGGRHAYIDGHCMMAGCGQRDPLAPKAECKHIQRLNGVCQDCGGGRDE